MKILVFGGSGTVGKNVLDYFHNNKFINVVYTYHNNYVSIYNYKSYCTKKYNISEIISIEKPELIINCISGIKGMELSLLAVNNKIDIFIANKETFCLLGNLILDLAKKNNVSILPLDSEHISTLDIISDKKEFKTIYLMGSGGMFYKKSLKELYKLENSKFFEHPNWKMGKKITFNSNIMTNKLLEVIEAYWLFNTSNIEILIERSSHIHSIVKFKDNTIRMSYYNPSMYYAISIAFNLYNKSQFNENKDIDLISNIEIKPFSSRKFIAWFLYKDFLSSPSLSKSILICVSNDILTDYFIDNEINIKEFNFYFKKIYNLYKLVIVNNIESVHIFINKIKERLSLWIEKE
jgi:1-deoxy-D-xylulose-5-phosphate reductoisomerase